MPLSNFAYDTFVSQEFSLLTECQAEPIANEFPEYESWLTSFVLRQMYNSLLAPSMVPIAFVSIRRAEGAIADYEEGRSLLAKLVGGQKTISAYFRTLRKFESAAAMAYQAFQHIREMLGYDLYDKHDGSPLQRLNRFYNDSKHANPQPCLPVTCTPSGFGTKDWFQSGPI